MNLVDPIQQRAIFNFIAAQVKAQNKNLEPQPGTLRLEALSDGSKGQYTFEHKKTSGNKLATEIRLDENDAFYITHVRLRQKRELPAKPGSGIYQTYANIIAFPVEVSNVATADVDGNFNSLLQIAVNSKEVLRSFDMSDSRVINTSQQSGATNFSESASLDGYLPLHKIVTLKGNASSDIKLLTPAYAGKMVQYITAPEKIYLALEFYGFLVVGGSSAGEIANNY